MHKMMYILWYVPKQPYHLVEVTEYIVFEEIIEAIVIAHNEIINYET